MRSKFFAIVCAIFLFVGITDVAKAQDNTAQPPASQTLPSTNSPRSIEAELNHLTKDLELTPEQQKQIRPLLQQHHDQIQALLDKNPTLTRQQLGPRIHAISDQTHRQIDALLTPHQKELAKAMQKRMQNRRPVPQTQPSFDPSMSAT
jgi:periplasmic protein CpxP/Spy